MYLCIHGHSAQAMLLFCPTNTVSYLMQPQGLCMELCSSRMCHGFSLFISFSAQTSYLREGSSGYVFEVALPPSHFLSIILFSILHDTITLKGFNLFMYECVILLVHMVHVSFKKVRLSSPLSLLGPSDFEGTWHTVGTQHGSVKPISSVGRPMHPEPPTNL